MSAAFVTQHYKVYPFLCFIFANCSLSVINLQSTLVISNSKGLAETLRDIRTSTYQSWESEEKNKLNNHI